MRLITNSLVHGVAGRSAAVTLGLVLATGITAQAATNDDAQRGGTDDASVAPSQDPTQQPPTEPAEPPPEPGQAEEKAPQLTLTSDTAIFFYEVLQDRTTDFEGVFSKVRDAMQQSDNPARKQQAQGMRLVKSSTPSDQGTVQYAVIVHPVVKDIEYEPGMLVYETFPSEANELFTEFQSMWKKPGEGLTGIMQFDAVMEFGSPGGGL